MGAVIHIASPTPAGPDADRVAYSVGRSLTASDFARQGRYVEARLLDLAPAEPGVINGLSIAPTRFDAPNAATMLGAFTIGVGTGMGADGRLVRVTTPMQLAWADLVQAVTGGRALSDGFYFLLVRTASFDGLDGPAPDPSGRTASDPLLDIRRESFVEAWLSASVGSLPAARTPAAIALALNTLVGNLTDASLAAAVGNGVPLAIVGVQNRQAFLVSQAAGRLPADPDGRNAMLLAQVREAFAMALAEPGANPATAAWQSTTRARFRFLPGVGELPLGLLLAPESATPACPFLPAGMAVNLQTIRVSQIPHLLRKALGRPRIDLADNTAQAATLALAIPDAAWNPALLDFPRGDPVLAADVHLSYAEARATQVALRRAWIALYGGMTAVVSAQPQAIGFLLDADAAAQNLVYLLRAGTIGAPDLLAGADAADTPSALLAWLTTRIASLVAAAGTASPPPAVVPTTNATTAARLVAARGYQVLDAEPAEADPTVAGHVPAASDDLLTPLLPALPAGSDFANWSAAVTASPPDPQLLQPLIDAGIVDPADNAADQIAAIGALLALPAAGDPGNDDTEPGALLRLALLQLFHEVFVRVTRLYEHTLDSHSRLIALQRQHLDIMSTSVSALAGGIMPDGSGLTFARLIPFVTLSAPLPTPTTTPVAAAAMAAAPAGATGAVPSGAAALTAGTAIAPTRGFTAEATSTPMMATVAPRIIAEPTDQMVARARLPNGDITPVRSNIGTILGRQTDVAQVVAQQVGVISQAPTFQYQPVQYATAAHITAGATLLRSAVEGVTNLRTVMRSAGFNITPTGTIAASTANDEPARYAGIVQTTAGLLDDIDRVQASALRIERGYLQFRDRIHALEARIAQLTNALAVARDTLRSAQATAAKARGDYASAQQLVQEEVSRLTDAVAARHQGLAAATGLFCVRELQTLVVGDMAPQLTLTVDTPTDVLPGCELDHSGPPAALQPFLDLLLEVPLSDWWHLRDHWVHLPDYSGVQRLGAMRAARLANRTAPTILGGGAASEDLVGLVGATHSAFEPVFRREIGIAPSLAQTQFAAFGVFALPDIVALPSSLLRINAEALRHRMESVTGCLFETLAATPPSVRYAWASMARDHTLPTLDFAHWPIPASLGTAAAGTMRRLSALVAWMSAQLHTDASSAARTALSNLVAAAVIAAAHGDPNEAVTGTVASTGGVPRPGVPIRVVLNRPPPIGTVLHLLDDDQRVVGTVRVDDHDPTGTTARVLTSVASSTPTSRWSVASHGSRTAWLPS